MTDDEFQKLGENILKWKNEYYTGKPSVSDQTYDYQEFLYCKEATARGIVKNKVGEQIDGKFYTFVGQIL